MIEHVDEVPRDQLLLLNLGHERGVAERLLANLALQIVVDPALAASRSTQIAILSAVNVAARSFRGGVSVVGDLEAPLTVSLEPAKTLGEAVIRLGGRIAERAVDVPSMLIGNVASPTRSAVRLGATGSIARVVPSATVELYDPDAHPLAATLSAGLAVGCHFRAQALDHPEALLYRFQYDFALGADFALPRKLWFIGLGHLGQAYLWTLAMLTDDLSGYQIILQDYDDVGASTKSTSILTSDQPNGTKKVAYCADWLRRRGARVEVVTEAFGPHSLPRKDFVVVAGLHDTTSRALLDRTEAGLIVDGGIGGRADDFLRFAVRRFPAERTAAQTFSSPSLRDSDQQEALIRSEAYHSLVDAASESACGLLTALAETAVGVPFVGLSVSTLVWATVMKQHLGLSAPDTLWGDLTLTTIQRN